MKSATEQKHILDSIADMKSLKALPSFDVLDRNLNVHKPYLIAASAGTGKTFSIENIVTRLLIENENISIENILAVTFTKSATRDLKYRILNHIKKTLDGIKNNAIEKIPDYCRVFIERNDTKKICSILEKALINFDLAQIFTIHGFCLKMLSNFAQESHFPNVEEDREKTFGSKEIKEIIRDYFRTELSESHYSVSQFEILFKKFRSFEDLENQIFELIEKDTKILCGMNYEDSFSLFCKRIDEIKLNYGFKGSLLLEDFELQLSLYKPIANKDLKEVQFFLSLFDKEQITKDDFDTIIKDGFWIDQFLSYNNIYKSKIKNFYELQLNYKQALDVFKDKLKPVIQEASEPYLIAARLAVDCKKIIEKTMQSEEKYRENDLLKEMLKACLNPKFLTQVQGLYKAAIIDEFQDTDPIQWQIFKKLFLKQNKEDQIPFYLVGDPKQSIYAFRQADIYTYIEAQELIGQENVFSLQTNYRSQKTLVEGLNVLFSSCNYLFPLPRFGETSVLPFSKVFYAKEDVQFSDTINSIHFFEVKLESSGRSSSKDYEKEYFFPFISQEIIRLRNQDSVDFNKFAVLVKDKNQAKRLASYFNEQHIPYQLQRQDQLNHTAAWVALKELLEAVENPFDLNLVKICLGGEILCFNDDDIKELDSFERLEPFILKLLELKTSLIESGFTTFFFSFLRSCWHENKLTVSEKLLSQSRGEIFYNEFYQVAGLLMEKEAFFKLDLHDMISFLKEKMLEKHDDDDELKNFSNPTLNAVSILTIHNSKGLEFDIVFALGLVQKSSLTDGFIPLNHTLIPCLDKDSLDYKKAALEIDAEKMRQLYVALTRAKTRLYIPVVTKANKTSLKPAESSPIDLLLRCLNDANLNGNSLYDDQELESNKLYEIIEKNNDLFSYTNLNEKSFLYEKNVLSESVNLICPDEVFIPKKNIAIQSFTSILKKKNHVDELSIKAPHDFNNPEKNIHTLPSSNLTGLLLHSILEKILEIDFLQIDKYLDLKEHIKPLIQNTAFEAWEDVLCEIGFKAVKFPNKHFVLSSIDKDHIFREVEFLYSDKNHPDCLTKGVIDLYFYADGKYYLVDWKSNWLGDKKEDYSYNNMHQSMIANDYHLQAHIYKNALKKYLKILDPRPFDDIFGGVYYIFLRGIDLDNPEYGVYHFYG